MKKSFWIALCFAVIASLGVLAGSEAEAREGCAGIPVRGDYRTVCIDGVWYEFVWREREARCVAPYAHVGLPSREGTGPGDHCLYYPLGKSAVSWDTLHGLTAGGPGNATGYKNICPDTPGIPDDGVYGQGGGPLGGPVWNEHSPGNLQQMPFAPRDSGGDAYIFCSQGGGRSLGTGKLFYKDCPAGFDLHVEPGRSVEGYARTVDDKHSCRRRARLAVPTSTPDTGSGTTPGSAVPTPTATAVPTPVGGVAGGCGKFKPGVDLCSTSKAEWTTCEGDWKVTVGSDGNQDALADVFAGSGLIDSVEVPGLPVGQDFTAYLWIKPVNGTNFTMSDRKAFSCSASGAPTPVPTVAAPVVPPAPHIPIATPTPDPARTYPGPFESFFVDNLKEVIFPFGFGAFGPGSAPTGASPSGTAKPETEAEAEPGAESPEADSGADAEPTVAPKPVAAGSVVVPGLGQKLCAGDTFKFRGGSGQWKVTVGTAADIDKYMHVDIGAVGAASNGELKITGVPTDSKPRVIVWNRAPGEKAYGAVSVTPYVCPK